ncbi:alpha/beta fold hydrolase [Streptomyces sp. NPDC060223]|uniref:alpha/beta fold hydrolase n=1 Tax=unclassified Streptomyces TaxID=2593676 RepID=UPI003626D6D3
MTTPTVLPTMQETTYDVDGKKIFVAETGDGPPVVMLHGGGPGASGVSNYARNIARLAENYRVIVPDMPGYGRSSKGVDSADPVGYLSRHIRGLLDELGLDKVHLVGNSYGGACALRLALDTPHRIDHMLLMGPAGVGTTRTVPTKGARSLLGYYTGDGPSRLKLETFIRNYLVFNAASVPDSAIEDRYQASIDPEVIASPPTSLPSGPGALRTLWKSDFTRDPRLSRLSVPTLVLWGAEDKVNRPSGARMLADRMPNCDLYMVANTGHWVQFERAELFNRICADFMGGRR